MSRRVDAERREAAVKDRTDRANVRLRLAQQVLTAFVDGMGIEETALRLNVSRDAVWRVRVWLGVQSGRQWKATRVVTGRLSTRRALEGVQP